MHQNKIDQHSRGGYVHPDVEGLGGVCVCVAQGSDPRQNAKWINGSVCSKLQTRRQCRRCT